jgi:hypothetical protein
LFFNMKGHPNIVLLSGVSERPLHIHIYLSRGQTPS